jgi:DNA-binding MarR family transcriptional regulator
MNGGTQLSVSLADLEACEEHDLSLLSPGGEHLWRHAFRAPCAPHVTVGVEDADGFLRGGRHVLLLWNVTDEDSDIVTMFLNYSRVGGLDGYPDAIFSEASQPSEDALFWRVPRLDTASLTVRLTAVDPYGQVAWNVTRRLRVDSTPPVPFILREGELAKRETIRFDARLSQDALSGVAGVRWRVYHADGRFVHATEDADFSLLFAEGGEYRVALEVWDVAGNHASLVQRVTIGNAAGAGGGLTITEITIGSLLGLLGIAAGTVATSPRVRDWGYRRFILPVYTRLKPDAVANQDTRVMIRTYIMLNPGDSYTDIKQTLELSAGVLTYHLSVLEREGHVRSQYRNRRKVYYPVGVPLPADGGGLHEIQIRALKVIAEMPGIGTGDLAGTLGISIGIARYHVRALRSRGHIRVERPLWHQEGRLYLQEP